MKTRFGWKSLVLLAASCCCFLGALVPLGGCEAFGGGGEQAKQAAEDAKHAADATLVSMRTQNDLEKAKADAAKARADAAAAAAQTEAERAKAAEAQAAAAKAQEDAAKGAALIDKIQHYVALGTTTLDVVVKPDGSFDVAAAGAVIGGTVGGPVGLGITGGAALLSMLLNFWQKRQRTKDGDSVAEGLDLVSLRSKMLNDGLSEQWAEFERQLTPAMRERINARTYASDLKVAA